MFLLSTSLSVRPSGTEYKKGLESWWDIAFYDTPMLPLLNKEEKFPPCALFLQEALGHLFVIHWEYCCEKLQNGISAEDIEVLRAAAMKLNLLIQISKYISEGIEIIINTEQRKSVSRAFLIKRFKSRRKCIPLFLTTYF